MPVLRLVVNTSEIVISFGNCFPNWTAAWDSKHSPESPSCWITFWLVKERCLQNIDEMSAGWWFGRVIPFLLRAMFTICWRQVSCCTFSSVKEVGYGCESAHRRASRIGQSEFGLEVGGCAWWTVRPTPRSTATWRKHRLPDQTAQTLPSKARFTTLATSLPPGSCLSTPSLDKRSRNHRNYSIQHFDHFLYLLLQSRPT